MTFILTLTFQLASLSLYRPKAKLGEKKNPQIVTTLKQKTPKSTVPVLADAEEETSKSWRGRCVNHRTSKFLTDARSYS